MKKLVTLLLACLALSGVAHAQPNSKRPGDPVKPFVDALDRCMDEGRRHPNRRPGACKDQYQAWRDAVERAKPPEINWEIVWETVQPFIEAWKRCAIEVALRNPDISDLERACKDKELFERTRIYRYK